MENEIYNPQARQAMHSWEREMLKDKALPALLIARTYNRDTIKMYTADEIITREELRAILITILNGLR